MRIVTADELESWLASGRVLEQDARGAKVVALENGLYLKIFYTRRNSLLARLAPSARRFQRNTETLQACGISAPNVSEIFWINKARGLSACLYHPLPGQSLEQIYLKDRAGFIARIPAVAEFFKLLHNRGIYFRSLHLGNILELPNGKFGLIDCLDLQRKRGPLSSSLIRRNLAHLENYLQRRGLLAEFPWRALMDAYQNSSEPLKAKTNEQAKNHKKQENLL
ncbi:MULTISPECIES: toluene tolerance protein [Stutzerimonas stutzeri subgroup]|uniref:toluene tolerance protein n=1 Tax=Stutzerimonas stutzeri subgroup TaxID=578833 RepID=UPI00210B0AB4|nr:MULTISPECIES: toluene tolerance protein [Stutzerimonas stutzeri subgroup]MCQ4291426.1 toluene tolerance protein [Stutzerimonas stutzeri]